MHKILIAEFAYERDVERYPGQVDPLFNPTGRVTVIDNIFDRHPSTPGLKITEAHLDKLKSAVPYEHFEILGLVRRFTR